MPAGAARLLPFFAASVAVHAAVFMAPAPERPAIAPAPAGPGHEVSIRLEAAAPADAEPAREPVADRSRPARSPSAPEPSPARSEPTTHRGTESPARPEPSAERHAPRPARETEPKRHAARKQPEVREPDPQTADGAPPAADRPRPAERIAAVDKAAGGSAAASSRAQRARLREAIELRLARHFRYPRLAQRRGWEGTVVLAVRVAPDGRLEDLRVQRSSGRALLDQAALRSLTGIGRLPELADRVGPDGLVLEIPVTYRLETA